MVSMMRALRDDGAVWLRQWWPVVAVTVVGALAITVAGVTRPDDKAPTVAGHVIASNSYDVDDAGLSYATLRLPSGPVRVGVSRPVTDTGTTQLRYDDIAERDVPDEGSFVAVSLEPEGQYDQPTAGDYQWATRVPTRVELVADGRSYPLPRSLRTRSVTAPDVERYAWVAVPGRPRTVSVAVTFAGVRQVVTPATGKVEAGRAGALYTATRLEYDDEDVTPGACGTQRLSGPFVPANRRSLDCELAVLTGLPYAAGFGWAPAGKRWVVARVEPPSATSFEWRENREANYYAFRDPRVRVSLDGVTAASERRTSPALVAVTRSLDPVYGAVFLVPADRPARRLDLAATFPAVNGGTTLPADAPRSPDITVTWTKELS